MYQVLWNLDVFYPLKVVIKSVKVAPKKNLPFQILVFQNTHLQVISHLVTRFCKNEKLVV